MLASACSSEEEVPAPRDAGDPNGLRALTLEELRDPEQCKDCHPAHYR
jgi:hypothetical protein